VDQDFKVKVGEFEGPLDLLLNLIEKRKLHITQVSLAQVADDYINHIQNNNGTEDLGDMANFILVASTLMLIKSLALLPGLQLTENEKSDVEQLENRLKQLQRIRALSQNIKELFGQKISFERQELKRKIAIFAPTSEIEVNSLWQTIKEVAKKLPQPEKLPEKIIRQVISLDEVISDLASRVSRAMKMSFSDFVKDKTEKINVIVSFLGMLELVKQGAINIEQKGHFSDISMETKEVGVPRY